MKKKDSYANFTVYESDKDCKTSDSISISASDGKLSVCHYIWDEDGTPYGDKDLEIYMHVDEDNTQKIAYKFHAKSNEQLVRTFGELFVRHESKAFDKIREWFERKGIAYSNSIY